MHICLHTYAHTLVCFGGQKLKARGLERYEPASLLAESHSKPGPEHPHLIVAVFHSHSDTHTHTQLRITTHACTSIHLHACMCVRLCARACARLLFDRARGTTGVHAAGTTNCSQATSCAASAHVVALASRSDTVSMHSLDPRSAPVHVHTGACARVYTRAQTQGQCDQGGFRFRSHFSGTSGARVYVVRACLRRGNTHTEALERNLLNARAPCLGLLQGRDGTPGGHPAVHLHTPV